MTDVWAPWSAEFARGSIRYITDRSAHPEGNYEVVSARRAAGSGEMLVQAALKMLEEIRAQATLPK